ncbi:MAG: amidohydrolase family protein [Bacteroidales bacterium]|nr:amidohydrolase family protein [Bacteroidales bacterium]MCF8387956.1 amidohydrolase family protein [Bacteroidales bacterium]MCF8399067.1 amidohydrolase family protein [Bacteroidales bacterium]
MFNGNIITVNPADDIAEAVAVKDSLFIYVGTNTEVQAYIGDQTEIIDLDGLTVTPGIIDAHTHMIYFGQAENQYVNLRPPEVTSIAEILAKIEERVNEVEPGDWIVGDGFFRLEDGRLPTKWDLDPVSPNNPVILNSMGGHFGTANSIALDTAGITEATENPPGGFIEHDSITGEVNGILWNHPGMDLVRKHIPAFDTSELIYDVKYAQDFYLADGLTSIQDVNTRGRTRIFAYSKTAYDGDLKIRTYMHFTIEKPHDAVVAIEHIPLFKYPMISHGGCKFLLDGQPPTSFTYDPHPGPSWNVSTWNADTLKKYVKMLHRDGRQLSFHVMGDAAIDMALDAIEEAQQDTFITDIRHRLEHVMIPTAQSLHRMKELDVLACMQPGAIYTGGDYYNYYWEHDINRLMPLRAMIDSGLHVSLGSDFPTVIELDPRVALWGALVRKTSSGLVIAPGQRISMQEALRAHTYEAAYASFDEDVKGSIEIGKYADMTVWTRNFYNITPAEILDANVVMTIVGGTVYSTNNEEVSAEKGQKPFCLHSNIPNPFSHQTQIKFSIYNEPQYVKLAIYDLNANLVKTIKEEKMNPGDYSLTWDGCNQNGSRLTSSVYFIKLTNNKYAQVRRTVLFD